MAPSTDDSSLSPETPQTTTPPPPPSTPFHPAFAVTNIKAAIPVVLTNEDSQYASWVEYFKIHVCAYNVMDHIDKSIPRPKDVDDHTWLRLDAIVKQWIYGTISPDLAATILKSGATANELWTRLEEIFQDQKETRAIYLDEQLANTKLVHFSNATDYCKQLKTLADQLHNVGSPVSDRQLVLRFIAGIAKSDYDQLAIMLQHQKPFPTFNEARSQLLMEERRRSRQDDSPDSALVTTDQTSSSQNSGSKPPPLTSQQYSGGRGGGQQRGRGRGRGSNRGRGRGRGRRWNNNYNNNYNNYSSSNQNNMHQASSPNWTRPSSQQWAGPYVPPSWTVASPPCPYPTQPNATTQAGILGPAPRGPSPQHKPDDQWYMDTGATSHLTRHSGPTYGDSNYEVQ